MDTPEYEKPEIRDYGSVTELTEMLGFNGPEDGGSKLNPMHHQPSPSSPILP